MFLGSVGMIGTVQAADEARPRGRPIVFSEINAGTSSTNTITLGSPSTGPFDLSERVSKPDSIDFRAPRFERMPAPSTGVIVSKKRNKQEDEWTSPEDAFDKYLMEEVLGLPDYLLGDEDPLPGSPRRNRGILSRHRGQTNSPAGDFSAASGPDQSAEGRPGVNSEQAPLRAIAAEGSLSPSKVTINPGSGSIGPPSRWLEGYSGAFGATRRVDMTPIEVRNRNARETQIDAFKGNLNLQPAARAERINPPAAIATSPFLAPASGVVNPVSQNPFRPPPGAFNPAFAPAAPTIPTAPTVPLAPSLPAPSTPDPTVQYKWMRPEPAPAFPRRQM